MSDRLINPSSHYRPDIDGLRAVAVLSVVIYHAFPDLLKGGFIGVDIFFVISGYLITYAILEGIEKGTFGFADFYGRRIRRIFPALLLVMFGCFVFGWYWLLSDELGHLGKHIAAGAGFVSNFVLWSESDYFDIAAETKPLLHLWSLGIEEQFYIIWPLLLWLTWKWKIKPILVIIAVASVSIFLNLAGIQENATATFFSPQTRFWELVCGSLLAWVALRRSSMGGRKDLITRRLVDGAGDLNSAELLDRRYASFFSLFGFALIVAGLFYIDSSLGFPGFWALIPVIGAMCIVAAGPAAWFNRVVLSNRAAVWFGLISFPLYLWHWPLLSFAKIIAVKELSFQLVVGLVLLSVLLAWMTYELVEKPLRFRLKSRWNAPALALLMVLMGGVGFATFKAEGFGGRVASDGSTMADRSASLRHNFGLGRFCIPDKTFESDLCKFGDAPNTYLWGDSYAMHLVEALKNGVQPLEFRQQTLSACQPLIGISTYTPPRYMESWSRNCIDYNNQVFEWLSGNTSFEYVILASTFRYGTQLYGDQGLVPAQKELYLDALRYTVTKLREIGMKPVFVAPPPAPGFNAGRCWVRMSRNENASFCDFSYSEAVNQTHQTDELFLDVEQFAPVLFLKDFICEQGICSVEIDGAPLYRDIGHLSVSGSAALGAKFNIANELQRKADLYWANRP